MPADRYLARDEQRTLAWSFVELIRPHLPLRERTRMTTLLGAGEIENTLFDLLDHCTAIDLELPISLVARLDDWARGYRGTPMEHVLRVRIAAVRSRPPHVPAAAAPLLAV
ncbi:MAG: hypothetical protein PGN30_15770 [Mycolicibacterium neoaurum]|uniref:hypothetical protein n=1 Tax=Mycolicibacterium neoaurum TaxID=1795 RepID=UPI002FF73244